MNSDSNKRKLGGVCCANGTAESMARDKLLNKKSENNRNSCFQPLNFEIDVNKINNEMFYHDICKTYMAT